MEAKPIYCCTRCGHAPAPQFASSFFRSLPGGNKLADVCNLCQTMESREKREKALQAKALKALGMQTCRRCGETKLLAGGFPTRDSMVCKECRTPDATGKDDEWLRLQASMRALVSSAATKPYKLYSRAYFVLGCSHEELRAHLAAQFSDGMGWHNRASWHIDHKIPLASAKSKEDMLRLNHYSNLQPLWAEVNLAKGARLEATSVF